MSNYSQMIIFFSKICICKGSSCILRFDIFNNLEWTIVHLLSWNIIIVMSYTGILCTVSSLCPEIRHDSMARRRVNFFTVIKLRNLFCDIINILCWIRFRQVGRFWKVPFISFGIIVRVPKPAYPSREK